MLNKRTLLRALPVVLTTFGLGSACAAASAADAVKIGYINWADTMAISHVAKYVLETKLNQPVQFVTADIGIQYGSVARGDIDVMLCGWLPTSHGAYYEKHKANLDDVGVVYKGGKNGWAVPAYVPESEVASIADLAKPEVKAKLEAMDAEVLGFNGARFDALIDQEFRRWGDLIRKRKIQAAT